MTGAGGMDDLLTLIGEAIANLQRSIRHFETSEAADAVSCLASVIDAIDRYLLRLPDDPLVALAHVDAGRLRRALGQVQDDLSFVISEHRSARAP